MRVTDAIYTPNPPGIKNYPDDFRGLLVIILGVTPEKLGASIILLTLFILFCAACTAQLALFILFYLAAYTT
jgi:hypothetical protein